MHFKNLRQTPSQHSVETKGEIMNTSRWFKWLVFFLISVSVISMSCGPLTRPTPFGEFPISRPTESPPFLWALYTVGNNIFIKETTNVYSSAVFRDGYSDTRHTLLETAASPSRPSAAIHRGSPWFAWREDNTIYARAIWWGPCHTRTVYEGGADVPTAPAIASYSGRLVVVWGVGNTLYISSSEFGVEWTTPISNVIAGEIVNSPALVVHGGKLIVGAVFGQSLYTIKIERDLTWGPKSLALSLDEAILPEVSLASIGYRLSMSFASDDHISVIHSVSGHSNWTAPVKIESAPWFKFSAPPALYYYKEYCNDRDLLYAVFPTGNNLFMKRSEDGSNWMTPSFIVDADASGPLPVAALVTSSYSVAPPTPKVVMLNDSGRYNGNTFNLVFISEGYLETEMDEFRALAGRVFDIFRIINPFSKLLDKINIYRIDLPSREKGVDASPLMAAAIRQGIWGSGEFHGAIPDFQTRYTDTALGAQYWGNWESPHHNDDSSQTLSSPNESPTPCCDAAEDLHNPHTRMISSKAIHIFGFYAYDLVQELLTEFDPSRDILYVIVNQNPEDGAVDKKDYNPVVTTPDSAVSLVYVHEMGHIMAQLDDEEESRRCWPDLLTDCGDSPNKTVNADLTDPNHKWAHFFVNEGRPGDSIVANPVSRPPTTVNFWDTSVVNASSIFNVGLWATYGYLDWNTTGGTIVYGPAPQCLMNHTGGTTHFCPVCAEAIVKKIFARAEETFSDADYHGSYEKVFVEYKHSRLSDPEYPKVGFISLNGNMVNEDCFTCFVVVENELCSVDVTEYLLNGANRLVFHQQFGFTRNIDLLSLQVVNSNGAALPLFPITDVSSIGTPNYFTNYNWTTQFGDLEFEFAASISAL